MMVRNEHIAIEDAVIIFQIISKFFYDQKLGIITVPNCKLVVIRKCLPNLATTRIGPIIDFPDLEVRIRSAGWDGERIPISY